ncbi:gb [Venturia nashicola]|nr:gb [Venturia nashicola]
MTPFLVQPGAGSARVSRPKGRRNGSTVTPATVQMSLDRLDGAALAHRIPGLTQNTSVSSSNVPSLVSSSSSTPQIQAVDGGPTQRNDSSRPSFEIKDEERHEVRIGTKGGGGYTPWAGEENISDCCGPKPTSSDPANVQPLSSCCGPKAPIQNDTAGQLHQDALHRVLNQGSIVHPSGFDAAPLNLGHDLNSPVSHLNTSYDQVDEDFDFSLFTDYENRRGCSTNGQISRHMNGDGQQQNCECGDGCSCFACLTHPKNNTMLGYAKYHSQYDSHVFNTHNGLPPQSQFSQPFYPENPYMNSMVSTRVPNLQQFQFSHSLHNWNGVTQQYDMSQGGLHHLMPAPASTSQPYSYPYSMAPSMPAPNESNLQTSQQPGYQGRLGTQNPLTGLNSASDPTLLSVATIDAEQTINHDSPSTDQDDNASVLSTSGFQIEQLRIPGCNDITGTCRCGDGCACSGCTIHGGHSGDQTAMNVTGAGVMNGHSHDMNTLGDLSDIHEFNLDSYHPNIQHSITPVSVSDEFHAHLQSPMIATRGLG